MLILRWQRLLPLVLPVLCAACGDRGSEGEASAGAGTLRVHTVNHPLEYFAERIGGELVEVSFPAPAGVDPAFWRPDREVIRGYQTADLILLNGAGYAKWTEKASLPTARLVDTSRAFRDRFIDVENAVVHAHGPGGEHSHAGTASQTWLDPLLAIEQARAVLRALANALPEQRDAFEQRFLALERDLRELDQALAAALAPVADRPLLASHPAYPYLARRYGLDLVSLHWHAGAMPGEDEWRALAMTRADHPAGWMLWEAEPHPAARKRLEQSGVRSVVFDPCANRPAEGDFLTVMRDNAARLTEGFAD